MAGRTDAEYRVDKKEQIKQYRDDNKERKQEYMKEYREVHKEDILQQNRDRYNKNRDNILHELKQKVQCDCGCSVSKAHLKRHYKSLTHKNYLESIH